MAISLRARLGWSARQYQRLTGASGARPDEFGFVLQSDVITNVKTLDANNETVYVPTVFEDVGQLQARLALKNPG